MTGPVSNALAARDTGPGAIVQQYKQDFAQVLPAHIKPEQWCRLASGLLRRNKNLAAAAARNPGSLLSALLDCARLGLEPGDTYHLVPIGSEIVGIKDWTGEVELIYRAGAVSSVKAEVVYAGDFFSYSPDMDRPTHTVDWFGQRGDMIGAYAYAQMKDGSTSRVVVMSMTEINKVKAVSKSSGSASSPWQQWPDRMVLKTVVKQLAKWVPSSAEYRSQLLKSTAAAVESVSAETFPLPDPEPVVDLGTGEILEGELLDGEPS